MRVVSWNVRSLRDGPREVAQVLRDLAPDVVCLQEAPRLLGWRWKRRWLAGRAGLTPVLAERSCGVTVLLGPSGRLVAAGYLPLPRHPGLHARAVTLARVKVGGTTLWVASTHLDLSEVVRAENARIVRSALPEGPLVLGADVNDLPGSPAWAALGRGLIDAAEGLGPTFPAPEPNRRIDGLWVSPDLLVTASRVATEAGSASDHLPIVVDLGAQTTAPSSSCGPASRSQ